MVLPAGRPCRCMSDSAQALSTHDSAPVLPREAVLLCFNCKGMVVVWRVKGCRSS